MPRKKSAKPKKKTNVALEATHKLVIYGSQGSGAQKKAGRYPRTGEVGKSECAEVFIKCIYGNATGNPSGDGWCNTFHDQFLAALRRQGVDDPDFIRVECTTHLDHFEMKKENGRWVAVDFQP